jgi:protein O-mannosyl-transferase
MKGTGFAAGLSRRRVALLGALAALAVSLPTLRNGFAIDDITVFVEQPSAHSLRDIPQFFSRGWAMGSTNPQERALSTRYYRPLPTTLGALEYAIFGLRPAGFHLTSALLHATTTALACLLLWQLTAGNALASLLGGLLFAVHPVQSEAFCAACYQTTLLAGLFSTLALLGFGRVLQRGPRIGPLVLIGVSLLLGLLSKEECFAVPLMALAWALVLRPAGWRRALLVSLLVMGISCAVVLALRSAFLTPSTLVYFPPDKPAWVALTMVRVAALYLELLLVPLRLCPFYDWFIIGYETGPSFGVAVGAAVLGLCLALVMVGVRRFPSLALGLLWVLLALAPVSQVIPIIVVAAERFLYLPMLGVALVAGLLLQLGLARARAAGRGKLAAAAVAVILLACAGRSLARVPDWRNDETVNRATAQAFPETPTPLYNLAAYYQKVEGNTAKALQALDEAQRRVPGWRPAIERAAQLRSGMLK